MVECATSNRKAVGSSPTIPYWVHDVVVAFKTFNLNAGVRLPVIPIFFGRLVQWQNKALTRSRREFDSLTSFTLGFMM